MELTKARLSGLVVLTAGFGYAVAVRGMDTFSWAVFLHTVIGTILAACGAAVFNQLMEVEADARMARTAHRPLPRDRIPRPIAFAVGWILSAFGIIHLGMMTTVVAGYVAAATLILYLFVYTPMKRFSSWNTVVGAVAGALPPLIGWTAGGGSLLSTGALFLFSLLFFWQLPHFAAINWMYRDQYRAGGFRMWSNDDESGRRTARIAVACSIGVVLVGVVFAFAGIMRPWFAAPGGLLGFVMLLLSLRFLRSLQRKAARNLFLYTLLYLPLAIAASYLAWK